MSNILTVNHQSTLRCICCICCIYQTPTTTPRKTMNEDQLSIFDIVPEATTKPLPMPIATPTPPQQQDLPTPPTTAASFDFPCEVPLHPNCGSVLSIGDRVVILARKYNHGDRVPGIVKGFISGEILIQKKDGEGLYERRELHAVTSL